MISQPVPNVNLSRQKPPADPGAGAIFNRQGDIIGGTLENQQPPPPPELEIYFNGWTPVYLGTAEKSPRIALSPAYFPWRDDEFSTQLACDELYDGEEATVIADLTRWWELVYRFIATRTKPFPLGGRDGLDFSGAVGTSTVHELQNHPLWVQFPFGAKPVHGLRGLPAGYRFWQAKLIAPDEADDLGHQPMRRRLIWRCQRYHDLSSGAAILYDHQMLGIPRVN